jgi:STE24 endopeptidase
MLYHIQRNWPARQQNIKVMVMVEDLQRAKRYSKRKIQLTIVQLLQGAAFLSVLLFSGISQFIRDTVSAWSANFYLQVAFYWVIFAGVYYLLFVGLDFYDGFLLEHKFKLSNLTVFGWLKKSMKKALLSFLMFLVAGEILYFFLRHFPNNWWLLAAAAWLLLTIVLSKIAPVLIIPLFYKSTPLANTELKERLLTLGKSCGVRAKDVFQLQLSKETKKANAAVAGWGKGRRILLGDTLLKDYSDEEIEAVFAHELGHIRMLHTWKILGFAGSASLASFYVAFLLFRTGTNIFGFEGVDDIAAFPLLALILMTVELVLMPIQNGYSRHLEKQADIFALDHIQNGQTFASAIRKLSSQNLSDPSPTRLVELFLYTHPPVSKRLQYAGQRQQEHPEC